MKRPKRIRVVRERLCTCEAYPFCGHVVGIAVPNRDDYCEIIEGDNGIQLIVSSGDIEGAPDTDKQACLLQIGSPMSGYACFYIADDDDVRKLIANLTNYLACNIRGEENGG